MATILTPNVVYRFQLGYFPREDNLCWIWVGTYNEYGYGRFTVDWNRYYVHRISYMLANNLRELSDEAKVLHTCDNPPCVNPKHLFVGTQTVNVADMVAKGRVCRGESLPQSKLTETIVKEIRRKYGLYTLAELSEMYNIGTTSVFRIVKRIDWKHVK